VAQLKSQLPAICRMCGPEWGSAFVFIAHERAAVFIVIFITSHHTYFYYTFSLYSSIQQFYTGVSTKEGAILFYYFVNKSSVAPCAVSAQLK
jgi:hypothetical protein